MQMMITMRNEHNKKPKPLYIEATASTQYSLSQSKRSMRCRIITAVLLAHLAMIVSPQEITICEVCGEGFEVGNPTGIFTFPSQPAVECGLLEETGASGQITPEQCAFLPGLIATECGCQASAPSAGEVPAAPLSPVFSNPSSSSDAPVVAPAMATPGCSVCGEGFMVTIPDAIFSFPGQPSAPCGVLEDAGNTGQIPLDQCPFLPGVIGTLCGCAEAAPVEPPIAPPVALTSAPITFAPIESPISHFPSTSPTTVTTIETESPSSGPTVMNTPVPTLLPTSISSDIAATLEPSFSASKAPITFAPVGDQPVGSPALTPSTLSPPCSICGDDNQVGNLDGIITLPGGDPITCGALEEAGEDGLLQPSECKVLPGLVNMVCDCLPLAPVTAMPSAPNAPFLRPTHDGGDDDDDDDDAGDDDGKGKKDGKGGKKSKGKGKGKGKKSAKSHKKSKAAKTGGKKGAGKKEAIIYNAPLPPRNDWPIYSPVYAAGRYHEIGE